MSLQQLRALCGELWNPIGVPMAGSPQAASLPFAALPIDEYDVYLEQVDRMIDRGYTAEEIACYLEKVETEYIGLTTPAGNREAFVAKAMAERTQLPQAREF